MNRIVIIKIEIEVEYMMLNLNRLWAKIRLKKKSHLVQVPPVSAELPRSAKNAEFKASERSILGVDFEKKLAFQQKKSYQVEIF